MRNFRPALLAGLFCALLPAALSAAHATERADFFDKGSHPSVRYDAKTTTWTLTNGTLQRVIVYDAKQGSLKTSAVRDTKRLRELGIASTSEGAFSFAADLKEPMQPLIGWKATDAAPAGDWTGTAFKDESWKPLALPLLLAEKKTLWMRCAIPADRMRYDRNYSLIFDRAIDGDAEIYLDGVLTEKVYASRNPGLHFVQVDLLPKNKEIAIKMTGSRFGAMTGSVGIAEVGSAPPSFDLTRDWKYMIHSVNTGADGSQILTISLAGLKQYEGFDLDVSYQIFPGDEPTMAKWFTFISHRQTRFLVEDVLYDAWKLPGSKPLTYEFPGNVFVASDNPTRDGLMTAVLSPLGASQIGLDGVSVGTVLHPFYRIKPDVRQMTAKSLVSFFSGTIATGAFAYQLYTGQYESRATASSVPTIYSTKFGYGGDINAATCEKIIPLASELGAKIFLLDDGWQTNTPVNGGTYGDWVTDRRKFPLGLMPISAQVREQNLRFGLFAAPVEVSEGSQAATDHSSWMLKRPDGSHIPFSDKTVGMCFTSGWEENFTKSMLVFCRELSVTNLRLGGRLYYDDCMEPTHDHPLGHALSDQMAHWDAFGDTLRTLNADFVLDRQFDAPADLTDNNDTGTFGLWDAAPNALSASDSKAVYAQADAVRRALYGQAFTRPTFTLTAETLCHLPTEDTNALEYLFTSAGANACNVTLLGQLGPMTQTERDTVHKWVKWNEENRPWLAYTQPLISLGRPYNPQNPNETPHLDGVLHLRSETKGKYGLVCLWNPSDKPLSTKLAFSPSDYFVRVANMLDVVRVKNGLSTRIATSDGIVTLPAVEVAPHSWEIFELRAPAVAAKPIAVAVPKVGKRQ